MSKDYAPQKRKPVKRKPKQSKLSVSNWLWAISGCFLGAFVTGLTLIKLIGPTQQLAVPQEVKSDSKQIVKKSDHTKNKPNFDFYTILPKMEVVVAEQSESVKQYKTEPKSKIAKQNHEKEKYVLQLASFKKFSDADQMKASLALKGIIVSIESVTLNDGETWHRVRSGPFNNINLAETKRKELKSSEVDSLLLKMKS